MMRSARPQTLFLLLAGLLLVTGFVPAQAADPSGIAVIAARGATLPELDRRDLALIFKRKKRFWPDGRRVAPVNLPAGQNLRRAFSVSVFGHPPEELDDYWRDQYFHGELPPFVASSEEAVIRFVASTPGAVGYVSACLADKRVAVLMVIDEGLPCSR
jgi:hypothetical protein